MHACAVSTSQRPDVHLKQQSPARSPDDLRRWQPPPKSLSRRVGGAVDAVMHELQARRTRPQLECACACGVWRVTCERERVTMINWSRGGERTTSASVPTSCTCSVSASISCKPLILCMPGSIAMKRSVTGRELFGANAPRFRVHTPGCGCGCGCECG